MRRTSCTCSVRTLALDTFIRAGHFVYYLSAISLSPARRVPELPAVLPIPGSRSPVPSGIVALCSPFLRSFPLFHDGTLTWNTERRQVASVLDVPGASFLFSAAGGGVNREK